jgi:hypothetical protein
MALLGLMFGTILLSFGMESASADHSDGHLWDWSPDPGSQYALQQGMVAGTAVTACSSELPLSSQVAVSRWNAALGFTAFSSTANCATAAVVFTSTNFGAICPGQHACTFPSGITQDPSYSITNPTTVYFNPSVQSDNSDHTNRDLTHELGHVLGFGDYYDCSAGATLMDSTEVCWYTTPQALDITNYGSAYFADAVASLAGSSPTGGNATLTWNPSDVHNEDLYGVTRDGTLIGTAAKNAGAWISNAEPPGTHTYAVISHTSAYCASFGGYCGSASVVLNVLNPAVDLQAVSFSGSTSPNENDSKTYTLTVKNNGTIASGGSYQAIKFNGAFAPNGQGACYIASIAPNGGQASCTTGSILMNFGGGSIAVTADNYNNVGESNEGNNVFSSGTLAVKPLAPTAVFVSPPFAAYGYTDRSAIETGFGVTMKRRSGGCGSSGWSPVPGFTPYLNAPLSGNSRAVTIAPWSPVTHGYCYRVTVTALGPYANSSGVTGSDVNYP